MLYYANFCVGQIQGNFQLLIIEQLDECSRYNALA